MVSECNKNMAAVFAAGWVVCLDESMSIWFSRWTCPGWVFCPRKPHDKGNEYHIQEWWKNTQQFTFIGYKHGERREVTGLGEGADVK